MSKKTELLTKIAALRADLEQAEAELSTCPEYDWDNMTDKEIEDVLTQNLNWHYWDNCPVGTLLKKVEQQEDPIIRKLGNLTLFASRRIWAAYMKELRWIVREYLAAKKAE